MTQKKTTALEGRIIEALNHAARPLAYPEIELAVGKQPGYKLGITLARMVISRKLHHREPKTFSQEWPIYSASPIPKRAKHPKRDDLQPNPR